MLDHFEKKFVTVNNQNICYIHEGCEGPTILLLHGFGGSHTNFLLNIKGLSKHFKVYALDLIGFGFSDKPKIGYTPEYIAKFVHDFMETLNIKKAYVVGNSMGGAIAMYTAVFYPHKVLKVVMADPFGFSTKLPMMFKVLSIPFLGKWLAKPNKKRLRNSVKALAHQTEFVTDEMIDKLYEIACLPGTSETLVDTMRLNVTLLGTKKHVIDAIKKNLSKLSTPTMVIWGKKDPILKYKDAEPYITKIPNVRIELLPGVGHVPQLEVPELFNELLIDFCLDGSASTS